jgi:hypothetical protein
LVVSVELVVRVESVESGNPAALVVSAGPGNRVALVVSAEWAEPGTREELVVSEE